MVQGGESSKAPKLDGIGGCRFALATHIPPVRRFKKDLCKYFERGHCDKGAQCTFAHGYEELRGGNKVGGPSFCERGSTPPLFGKLGHSGMFASLVNAVQPTPHACL